MSDRVIDLARSERAQRFVTRSPAGRELFHRYVAGESLDELLLVVAERHRKGLVVSIDPLRAPAATPQEAAASAQICVDVLGALEKHGLAEGSDLTVKLDALGLSGPGPRPAGAMDRLRAICRLAGNSGATVTVDTPPEAGVERTLDIVRELRMDHPGVGVELLAMLRRTEADCRALAGEGLRIRLSKGGWRTSDEPAFSRRHDIDLSFVRCLRVLMDSGARPVVASHDPRLVEISLDLARRFHRGPSECEFQMLLGVRPLEQRRLADIGCTMRTQLPFGPNWYDYFLRRVLQRPDSAALYARSLVSRH
ncbi:proline dehydrogenase [Propionibacterium cyclohexanicum]|uniref:Proline dehydrogenase n=1 Tax=Propionibacterium cyclohexanicum TaxID=64702 RepID=A0A1H9RU88_9ACTN|nr:proline dehydrogenase family protein [Propionibacterium cyclohexanicum]SER76164.1 proline dehydrogenase [Propionibacterium cyclohexanicum]